MPCRILTTIADYQSQKPPNNQGSICELSQQTRTTEWIGLGLGSM